MCYTKSVLNNTNSEVESTQSASRYMVAAVGYQRSEPSPTK